MDESVLGGYLMRIFVISYFDRTAKLHYINFEVEILTDISVFAPRRESVLDNTHQMESSTDGSNSWPLVVLFVTNVCVYISA